MTFSIKAFTISRFLMLIGLGLTSFYPIVLGYGDLMESFMKDGPFGKAILQKQGIDNLCIICATIIFPSIIDNILDLLIYGFDIGKIERTVYLIVLFVSFFGQYLSIFSHHPVSLFTCFLFLQIWVFFIDSLFELYKTCSQFFNIRAIIFFSCLLQSTILSGLTFITFGDTKFLNVILALRILLSVTFGILLVRYLIHIGYQWRASNLPVLSWFATTDNNLKTSLFVSIIVLATIIIYTLLVFVLNAAQGTGNISTSVIISYLVFSGISNLCICLIPQRIYRLRTGKLEFDLETKKTFVRYVSHELRTPVGMLLSGLEQVMLIVQEGASTKEIISELENLRQPCITSLHTLNDFLDYEKLDAGIMSLEQEVQDPMEFIENTLSGFKLVARSKQIDLQILLGEIEAHKYFVNIDENKISQVLRNLLSNALKFTSAGGSISLRGHIHEGSLVLEVKDTGYGISAANQKKLFYHVVQFHAKAQQNGGGSGMGMWISKKIIDLHGGKIGVYSAGEGLGTTFHFSIPLCIATPDQETGENDRTSAKYRKKRVSDVSVSGYSSSSKAKVVPNDFENQSISKTVAYDKMKETLEPMFILVVDDASSNRKVVIRKLERQGHHCAEAADGLSAVDMVRESMLREHGRFDAITLDDQMPHMNGSEAAEKMRSLGYSGLIIFVTGNLFEEDIQNFFAHGADAVIPKPFDVDLFYHRLGEIRSVKLKQQLGLSHQETRN